MLAVTLAGCSGTTKDSADDNSDAGASDASADPSAPLKKNLELAFLPKQINNPYEQIVDKAGIKAAGEFDSKGKEVGPPTPTPPRRCPTSTPSSSSGRTPSSSPPTTPTRSAARSSRP
ncbi:hypothetical protein NKH77_54585 [Streptomyces sp. M19]